MTDTRDQLQHRIADVARWLAAAGLIGKENAQLSTRDELRFGSGGSVSVIIGGPRLGCWYDHENGEGGDTWDFIRIKACVANTDIPEWVKDELGIELRRDVPQHVVRTFDYHDERGEILFQVRKWGPQKRFSQHAPDGRGGWTSGKGAMAGVRLVPYRLPELLAAGAAANGTPPRCFLPEGEKDVDALRRWNLTASCNPMGAGKWKPEFNQHFAGFDIVILPDNDTAGRRHAQQIAAYLAPVAASVRIVQLHGLPEGGDVSNWIHEGGSESDLDDLVDATELFDPTKEGDDNDNPAPQDSPT